jgi:hypothetical protein
MKNFIAVVKSTAGIIDKYQDFDTQAEADAHAAQYGGFVAANPGALEYWIVGDGVLTFDTVRFNADQAALPTKIWERQMAESDTGLPRYAEDLYDALNPSDQANVSQSTKNKVAAKKALRATKP